MIDLNYFKVFLVIFFSTLLSGLSLIFINYYFFEVNEEIVHTVYSPPIQSIPPVQKTIAPISSVQIDFNKLEQERLIRLEKLRAANLNKQSNLRSVRTTNDETCAYWRSRYGSNKSVSNRNRMESSCARAMND